MIIELDLSPDLVGKAIIIARVIALKNRCTYVNSSVITCVSNNQNTINELVNSSVDYSDMYGCCFSIDMKKIIYIRPGRRLDLTVTTLCHELAHAFTNPRVKHGYSWRSLFLLYYATLPRIFDIHESKYDFKEVIELTLKNYEPRGNTPYTRHLKAMLKMRQWYIDNFERE